MVIWRVKGNWVNGIKGICMIMIQEEASAQWHVKYKV
jgi:hypothetical protein